MNEANGATSSSSQAVMCLERIGGHMTKLLELHTQKSALQIVFVPGNPSVVIYYQEYLDVLYDILKGGASVTTISHIGLGEGFVGLCMGFQCHGYHLPTIATVESCAQLHVNGKNRVCNIGSRTRLWFLKEFQSQISFFFGTDDHWGPLSLLADISKEIPQLKMVVERKGHLHTFNFDAKFSEELPEALLESNPALFSRLTLVIATQNVMLIIARSYGLAGLLCISVEEHDVIESKPDNKVEDL
ncbi:unnamed protein product [Sphagnum balticum]